MDSQATKRPWKLIDTEIIDSDSNRIAQCISRNPDINEEANTKLIVKAVNERDELIEVLSEITDLCEALHGGCILPPTHIICKSRKALFKAKGE